MDKDFVYIVWCDWVGAPEIHAVFSNRPAAEEYISQTVGTKPGEGYHNPYYVHEQFSIDTYEVRDA